MVVATEAQRAVRWAQLTRQDASERARAMSYREGETTIADLVRAGLAVEFVTVKGQFEPQPVPTPAFNKLLTRPDRKTVAARVKSFLTECDRDSALRRKALDAGIDLDAWQEALDYDAA